jgi:hypothetical protein
MTPFSEDDDLIHDSKRLENGIHRAVCSLLERERFSLRPYIVYKLETPISPTKLKAVKSAVLSTAIKAELLNFSDTIDDARRLVDEAPQNAIRG